MKKFITLLAVIAGFFVLTPVQSQARDSHHHHGDHHSSRSYSHACRSCGSPIYRERVFLGRDRHGHPCYDWRTVSHRCRSSHGHGHGHHGHGHHRGGSRGHISLPGIHLDFGGRR